MIALVCMGRASLAMEEFESFAGKYLTVNRVMVLLGKRILQRNITKCPCAKH